MALIAGPFLSYASMRRRYRSTSARQVMRPALQRGVNLRNRGFLDLERRWSLRPRCGE